eukprot:TRINITY_DN6218_c0_g2_i1.p1 TRINITY_DN6218_c0_g2~~TRINITY_DN6218_c0_g2_i1.p1  ORF type:complete len:476 (+),score=131.99 TRINITY_DN6218_c0_g2_i1:69-1496(+)
MVEGHSCHRVAEAHKRRLMNKKFKAISPNKRFVEGAAAVNDQPLTRIEVHGKNLFYFFGKLNEDNASDTIVHIHFGMAGRFAVHDLATAPAPTDKTRLRLENEEEGLVVHLSAMTVRLVNYATYTAKVVELGEDPLRSDADPVGLYKRVTQSKKSIGALLMDQGYFAGVGNIYRAEILFKAGVHPEVIGRAITQDQFDGIWKHSVLLLQRGFQCGSILTVDPEEAVKLNKPELRRYIYNQKKCGRCDSVVKSWSINARTCYACTSCQVMPTLSEDRQAVVAKATEVQVFESHCAPDTLAHRQQHPEKLKVAELRKELSALGMQTSGNKPVLVKRLSLARSQSESAGVTETQVSVTMAVQPGVDHIANMATATAAAREKQLAGEGRNVEHVADLDTTLQGQLVDWTDLHGDSDQRPTPTMAREITPPSKTRRRASKKRSKSKRQLYQAQSIVAADESQDTGVPALRRSKRCASVKA